LYPNGYADVYPRTNGNLLDAVRRHGALVSEYFLGEAPLAWHFTARNRFIAGLASAVVVEAPEQSGALIIVRHGLDAERVVWAVAGPPGVRECRNSDGLLADGAGVLWDVPEFVEAVAPRGGAELETPVAIVPAGLPETEAAVLSGMRLEPRGVDAVARRSGVQCPRCSPRSPCWSSRARALRRRRCLREEGPPLTGRTLGELWSRYTSGFGTGSPRTACPA
jgi:predicted Rossmann fold nucleotide-binding protein DprA/Smf involved in DNA uptake